ncbi:MAG: ABC transporter ATP-binding protein [Thermodesulfobacteriota bacterium]
MLELRSIAAHYEGIHALHDVSFSIGQGEIISLIGANGAGKTTTLMTISGMVAASRGRILFEGEEITGRRPEDIVRLGISQVPEGRRIFPQLTIQENLDLGAWLRRDRKEIEKDRRYVFDLFPILRERRQQSGGTLSGGEQQMLAISRALMARPRLLLLDEPSLGLAPMMIRHIFAIIAMINREHATTILLVEQNANMALHVAHRGYVMENGRITHHGSGRELLDDEAVRAAYLGI